MNDTRYLVPAEPFRRIIRQRMLEVSADDDLNQGIGDVSRELGVSDRVVYRILREQKSITFDMADRIVTRLVGPFAWAEDPKLRKIYDSFDLRPLDWSRPTSDAVLEELRAIAISVHKELGCATRAAKHINAPITTVKKLVRAA